MRFVRVWGAGLGAFTLFFLMSASSSLGRCGRYRRLPPCITAKLYKSTGYMECEINKWNWEEGGGGVVFRKGKLELLALTETKLMRNGEVSWCGVNGIIAGVQVLLSISHILVKCPTYSVLRNRFDPSLTSVPPLERLSFLFSDSPTFSYPTLFAFLWESRFLYIL